MENRYIPVFFFITVILIQSDCTAVDTISANQEIKDGETIISEGKMFEMGFFSPGNSTNRYLGIWYKKISSGTVVWVANRETPITDKSGMFQVSKLGVVLILKGDNSTVWPSNSMVLMNYNHVVAVQLLDNGNLVVWHQNSTNQYLIWQSFDYPGDTLLPGMKFGKNLVTGIEWNSTSWKSPDDPYIERNSCAQRIVLTWDGKNQFLHWIERIQDWIVYADIEGDSCAPFKLCGPYGSCSMNKHPLCSCMEGFEQKFPQEWAASDWTNYVKETNLLKKLINCSCVAYANLDIRNGGTGCLQWFDELRDIKEFDGDDNIYIKMAASVIAGHEFNKRKDVFTIVLPIMSATLLLSAMARSCMKRKKMLHMKKQGELEYALDKKNTSMQMENLDEIQFFSLYKVVKATDNFSDSNKIGEGGFGPVYKNELISIAKLQHRNLVKLLGYCIHENEMILIYEYMTNKSLDSFIFDETKSSMLDWPHRFHIIHGIARGILYLHQDSRLQIIQRDLKAGNILLDSGWHPKISDFGLARKFAGQDASAKTKKVVGTYGYISPEYAVHGRFSIKSDVFSFGVIVLEIVSGMKNREFSHEEHRDNLLGHAWRLYKENKSIELMSESLRGSCIVSEVLRSIHVALLCVQHHAEDRPTMLSIVLMLVSESALPEPNQPAFFTEQSFHQLQSLPSVDEFTITLLNAR
ncbi:G-type lectin S-receptor-like serine/threonine-protein kinase [Tanacetum coccineum]